MIRKFPLIAATAMAVAAATQSFAATTAVCPDDIADVGVTDFTVTVSVGTIQCVDYGDGNFQKADLDDLESLLGYSLALLDKSDDGGSGTNPDAFDIITGSLTGGLSGSFEIDGVSGYNSYALVVKGGGGQNDPDWAAFTFTNIAALFNWSISPSTPDGKVNALSHMDLYGFNPGSGGDLEVIPLPAAAWMLLAGVGGLAAMARRRKAAA